MNFFGASKAELPSSHGLSRYEPDVPMMMIFLIIANT